MNRTLERRKRRRLRRHRRGVSGVVLAVSALLALEGAAPAPAASAEAASGQRDPAAAGAERPFADGADSADAAAVRWHACADDWDVGKGWKCGTLETPLDHRDPKKGTLKLAVAKLPAREPSQRIGSLITNPGGPGGSGLDNANNSLSGWSINVSKKVRDRFDLVAYDARGVGNSTPALDCTPPDADDPPDNDPPDNDPPEDQVEPEEDVKRESPRNKLEMLAALKAGDDSGAECVKAAGRLVPYMTTVDNVHDLDRLRAALGDPKLSYLGISYGTTIGSVYANIYPDRVRSIILHGVVDAKTQMNDPDAYSLAEASGDEETLKVALRACDEDPEHCDFGKNAQQKFDRLARYWGDPQKFDYATTDIWSGLVGLADKVRDPSSAVRAARDLQGLYEKTFPAAGSTVGKGSGAGPGADGRDATATDAGGTEDGGAAADGSNEEDVLTTTDCLDLPTPAKDDAHWRDRFTRAQAKAPLFGPAEVVSDIACRDWPDDHRAALPRHTGPWDKSKSPILIMNQQWDHSTPIRWARNMTKALGQKGMVVIDGFGHGDPTDCSRSWAEEYLLHGKTPTGTAECKDGDTTPFN